MNQPPTPVAYYCDHRTPGTAPHQSIELPEGEGYQIQERPETLSALTFAHQKHYPEHLRDFHCPAAVPLYLPGEHRDQVLAEAAKRQRGIASRLPEHLAGAAAIVTTAADVIDPAVQVLFQPARVRDAASDYRDQVLAEGAEILRPLRSVINAQSNPAAYATALLLAARAGSQEQEAGQ